MKAIYQQGAADAPVLVLLHGTGGDEQSLLEVGKALDPQASLLGIRGNVLENGMSRYFKRLAEGVYDEADLALRGDELANFIRQAAKEHHFSLAQVVLVGYSNGANIAIRLLLNDSDHFKKAILYHAMYPVENLPTNSLPDTHVFLSFGRNDPIVSLADSAYVQEIFTSRGAVLSTVWTPSHQLTYEEVEHSRTWLTEQ